MISAAYPNYSLPCFSVEAGSETGFHPEPPKPPAWGLLLLGLIVLMLVFMIWFFRGLGNDINRPDLDNSGGASQLMAPDSKALQKV
jgi:hypothetical protein